MELIIIIIAYILNLLLNRRMYFKLIELDGGYFPNPPAIVACFFSLIGTLALGIHLIVETKYNFTFTFPKWTKFFVPKKYK